MFRKLKKLYFKIYHLFKLIGVFIVVFGLWNNVYAKECNAVFKGTGADLRHNESDGWHDVCLTVTGDSCYKYNTTENCSESELCLDTTKDYTIFAVNENNESQSILWGTGFRWLYYMGNRIEAPGGLKPAPIYSYTYKAINNTGTVFIWNMNSGTYGNGSEYNRLNGYKWYIVEGTETCIPTETPPEPEPEDNIYSGFLTIYFDRITYLAEGFTNNPYLIAMVGIIFGFVVLDILLKILHIRRKK